MALRRGQRTAALQRARHCLARRRAVESTLCPINNPRAHAVHCPTEPLAQMNLVRAGGCPAPSPKK